MNITEEKIDNQNAFLKIKIEPVDYSAKYDEALKNYRKRVSLPGFRAGKVPMGVVKQRFGKSLLADEMNKMLNDTIQNYITEKDLKVLGSPIPSDSHDEKGDWDNPQDFEFVYELGLAPEMKVEIEKKDKFEYFTIEVDQKLIDRQINDLARKYGKLSEADISEENDMLIGDFVELDENDEIKAGGILNRSTISIGDLIEPAQEALIGKKVDDEVIVNPHDVSRNHDDLARMLNTTHEAVHHLHHNFKFIIKEVKRMEPAELNQELYDKLFGEGVVSSEKELRERISADLANGFVNDSNRLFKRDIVNQLIKKYAPTLPDAFLKKWIMLTNEKPITPEDLEAEYGEYQKSLQWQLIFNDLLNRGEIKVDQEEAVQFTMARLAEQYAQYGIPAPEEKELRESAMRVLSKKEQAQGVFDQLHDQKLVSYVREKGTVNEKEIPFDTFVEKAAQG